MSYQYISTRWEPVKRNLAFNLTGGIGSRKYPVTGHIEDFNSFQEDLLGRNPVDV
ncbi:hypothetical protein D3C86_1961620 [compost metagenome]